MARIGEHAIVIGASIGGLLAARALSDVYDCVTIIERDALSGSSEARKGVPQGRHAHGLLARGSATLERLFPGLTKELVADGAMLRDIADAALWHNFGCCLKNTPSDIRGLLVSRPTLENAVRRRVKALFNVRIAERTDAKSLVFDSTRGRVAGIRTRSAGEKDVGETIAADLVVDAGGRVGQSGAWLAELGYEKPAEERVTVDIGYTTRQYRRRPDHLPGKEAVIVAATPPDWRLGVILAQDGDRWIVTLGGYLGDRAPEDDEGFLAFARGLPRREIYDVIKDAEPLTAATSYSFKASLRRHYEKLARFPDGYLAFGDAICSFNPIYGQGMSVAAMEAVALGECLSAGVDDLGRRFFAAAAKIVDIPWQLAVGADLAHPNVAGKKGVQVRFINWYISKLYQAGERDAALAIRFLEVVNLLRPPSALLQPHIAWRVWRAHRRATPATLAATPSFSA